MKKIMALLCTVAMSVGLLQAAVPHQGIIRVYQVLTTPETAVRLSC